MKYNYYFFFILIITGCALSGCVTDKSADVTTRPPQIINCSNITFLPFQYPMQFSNQKDMIIYNQTKKPEYISTKLSSPAGSVIINAWVNNTVDSIPLVRFNQSRSIDISLDRSDVSDQHPSNNITEDRIKEKIISESLPDESEAVRLAKKDLLPFGGLPQDASEPEFRKNIGSLTAIFSLLQYSHSIDGLPVEPDGDHIMLELGQNGELFRLNELSWRDVEYIRNIPVISADEALVRLQNGMYSGYPSKNSEIDSVKLGYTFSDASDVPEPVWIFSNTNLMKGAQAEYFVYAAKEGPVSLNASQTSPKLDITGYSNNAMLHNTSSKRPVTGQEAVNIVKLFEGNTASNVTFVETVHVNSGCGDSSYDYHLLLSDYGRYKIFPGTGEIMGVEYSPIACSPPIQPLNASQALMVSQDYLVNKFMGFKEYSSAFVVHIRENNETFVINYPEKSSKLGTEIFVNKRTGQVTGYAYEDMIEYTKC